MGKNYINSERSIIASFDNDRIIFDHTVMLLNFFAYSLAKQLIKKKIKQLNREKIKTWDQLEAEKVLDKLTEE